MRLLHTSTLQLHEFPSDYTPYYAILSHRWDAEEVSFRDMQDGLGPGMAAFAKIKACCAHAASEGLQYVWIDTCCIDKSSSTELSEAINSMFKWYQDAQVCYAYLSDVPEEDANPSDNGSAFRKSKWFTRGIKPSLSDTIISITGIKHLDNFWEACIAQKMSWASERQTTRVEDIAYCLMGLFNVNMPPLYGEGENAFMRLQLEILKKEDDESIFAWKNHFGSIGGLLADSPSAFKHSGDIQRTPKAMEIPRPPFSMTNKGLGIVLQLIPPNDFKIQTNSGLRAWAIYENQFLAPLNCRRENSEGWLMLHLSKGNEQTFKRLCWKLNSRNDLEFQKSAMQLVYIKQNSNLNVSSKSREGFIFFTFLFNCRSIQENGFSICESYKDSPDDGLYWSQTQDAIMGHSDTEDSQGIIGAVMFENDDSDRFMFVFGTDDYCHFRVEIIIPIRKRPLSELISSIKWNKPENEQHRLQGVFSKSIRPGLSVCVALGRNTGEGWCEFVGHVTLSQT